MMKKVAIVSAVRTPIGSFMGSLSKVLASQLGATAIRGALDKVNLNPELVDEVLMGQVIQSGSGQAPARQASIYSGIPNTTPATTINKVCASGMKALMQAAQSIALSDNDIVIAGGMENMSLAPHYHYVRTPKKFGKAVIEDSIQRDGLLDAYNDKMMGCLADSCAQKYSISRKSQDEFAVESYKKSELAWSSGKFKNEIVPVKISLPRRESFFVSEDEEYKNINIEKLKTLSPAFSKDGTVTAANASKINDGAAALVLMSEDKVKELNLKPLAYIESYADASQEPEWFTTAPTKALIKALEKAKVELNQIDFFELNEAFSVVGIVNTKLLGLDKNKVNIHGGAVSLGHPLGCSGARIIVSLTHILQQNNAKYGAAAICNGGGGASAIILRKTKA